MMLRTGRLGAPGGAGGFRPAQRSDAIRGLDILPPMSIIRAKSHLEEYRARTRLPDIAELSSRSAQTNRAVAAAIVPELKLSREDALVDVGCGDGNLLELVANLVESAIGICPTPEELQRLKQQHSDLDLVE